MQIPLAYDPPFNQTVPYAVGQSHETGVLVGSLRISAQGEFYVPKNIDFQCSSIFCSGARSCTGFDRSTSSFRYRQAEKINANNILLY